MKKFLALMLAMLMALSLVACGGGNNAADDNNANDGDAANTDESLVVLENVVDWGETEPYRVLVQKGDPKGLLPGINEAIADMLKNNKVDEFIADADSLADVAVEVTAEG